jgi:hypothetical protein
MSLQVLFDNSALNHLSGQKVRGVEIDGSDRERVIDVVRGKVAREELVVITSVACIGELAGLYFADRSRFDLVCKFLFEAWDARILRPTHDEKVKPLRIAMELAVKGRVPVEHAVYSGKDWKHIRRAFLEGKRQTMDRYERDAKARKRRYTQQEKQTREGAKADLAAADQDWTAEFDGWEVDPKKVVDEWTAYEMNLNRRFYGLPKDPALWPKPRDFVSLWHARGYQAARVREIIGHNRKIDGGDLFDAVYFEDAAYADVLVTSDDGLARRGRSLWLSSPRILLTEEWVREMLA